MSGERAAAKMPPEPKTSSRLRDRITRALGFSATFAAAAGIILGVFEYHQRGQMIQARETMAQIEQWDDDGVRNAYRSLSRAVTAEIGTLSDADRAAASEDPVAFAKLSSNLSRRILREDTHADELDDIVYFFTRLGLCIEADLCDADVARVFFRDTLATFLDVFGPVIEELYDPQQAALLTGMSDRFEELSY